MIVFSCFTRYEYMKSLRNTVYLMDLHTVAYHLRVMSLMKEIIIISITQTAPKVRLTYRSKVQVSHASLIMHLGSLLTLTCYPLLSE